MRLLVGRKAHVFSFNSSDSKLNGLKCHLELAVPSSSFGFSVFLEEMSLSGSVETGCTKDFVQFGRDILFVTTHMSSKYCGKIELPIHNKAGTPLHSRIYHEQEDREMDIWMHITRENQENKIVNMVVTPFMKTCKEEDRDYKQCGYRDYCISRELFCDGRVNCASQETQHTGLSLFQNFHNQSVT